MNILTIHLHEDKIKLLIKISHKFDFKKLNLEFQNQTKLLPYAVKINVDSPTRFVLIGGLLRYIASYFLYITALTPCLTYITR